NRRPVDYAWRGSLLAEMEAVTAEGVSALATSVSDGRARLWVRWRALQLRARYPDLFREGDYIALDVSGQRAAHVVAFARRHEDLALIAVAGRLWGSLGPVGRLTPAAAAWSDTAVDLAPLGKLAQPRDIISLRPGNATG